MHFNPLMFVLLFLIAFIAAVHGMAVAHSLYWAWWWLDIFMHVLGGLWVGLAALWLFFDSGYLGHTPGATPRSLFVWAISSAIVVGIGWEIFEAIFDVAAAYNYVADTISDLACDIAGALCAALLFIRYGRRVVV